MKKYMKKYKWIVIAVCTISLISGCGKSTEKQISEQLEAGNKYLIEGNYEAAIVAFNKVIEIDPKIFEAYKKCAESYKEMDDFQNAIAVMENGVDVIGEDNLSEEDISFWKELYYSWEKWEEEQENDSSVLVEINQSILDRWPDEEQAQENLKSISGYKRVPTLLASGYYSTYGIHSDGTVAAVGYNDNGQWEE